MIKIEAKGKHLTLTIKIECEGITKEIFTNHKYQLQGRLQARSIGLRSDLTMFLLDIERDLDLGNK